MSRKHFALKKIFFLTQRVDSGNNESGLLIPTEVVILDNGEGIE